MRVKRRSGLYSIVNILVIIISGMFVINQFSSFENIVLPSKDKILLFLPIFLVCFIIIHISKMLRYYVILLEEKIKISRFIKVYIKITFVNMALPFKSGELFRIYCFSRETKNVKTGLFSVIIDRLFDTCVLLVILLPYDLLIRNKISGVTALLTAFAVIVLFVYKMYMPTYNYLNSFLITNTKSKKSIVLLHVLENTRTWYEYVAKLLTGRSALVFAFSCLGWLFEFGALKCITALVGEEFGIRSFIEYIQSIFGVGQGTILSIYTLISCIVLLIVTLIVYAFAYLEREKKINA